MPDLPRIYSTSARLTTVRGQREGQGRMRLKILREDAGQVAARFCEAPASQIDKLAARLARTAGSERFGDSAFGSMPAPEREKAVRELAGLGYQLFKALVPPDLVGPFLELAAEGGPIGVGEDLAGIPWEYLHPAEPAEPAEPAAEGAVKLDGFLGSKVLFVRQFAVDEDIALGREGSSLLDANRGNPFSRVTVVDAVPHKVALGYVFDDQLPTAKVPAEARWHRRLRAPLELRCCNRIEGLSQTEDVRRHALRDFVQEAHDVLHFDCHVERFSEILDQTEFRMQVRHCHWVSPDDMREWSIRRPDLLVVLNSCYSDASVDRVQDSFAAIVRKRGAHSVVGVSARVNDAMALAFAVEFYNFLLCGRSVGEALMGARTALTKTGNPAALLYTLHGAWAHVVTGSYAAAA